jgi:hypothetical protein
VHDNSEGPGHAQLEEGSTVSVHETLLVRSAPWDSWAVGGGC